MLSRSLPPKTSFPRSFFDLLDRETFLVTCLNRRFLKVWFSAGDPLLFGVSRCSTLSIGFRLLWSSSSSFEYINVSGSIGWNLIHFGIKSNKIYNGNKNFYVSIHFRENYQLSIEIKCYHNFIIYLPLNNKSFNGFFFLDISVFIVVRFHFYVKWKICRTFPCLTSSIKHHYTDSSKQIQQEKSPTA